MDNSALLQYSGQSPSPASPSSLTPSWTPNTDCLTVGTSAFCCRSRAAMDRRRGVLASIFLQTRALLVKNALLSWRNLTATALQLGASFLFIFLIWCIQEAINLRLATNTTFQNLTTPPVLFAPPIPACETGYFMTSPCYDLLWSGNDSAVITSLVQNMSANNPGRPFDFATKARPPRPFYPIRDAHPCHADQPR